MYKDDAKKKQKNHQIHPKIIKMTPKNGYFGKKIFFQNYLKMREEVENHPKNPKNHPRVVKIRYIWHIQNLNMLNIKRSIFAIFAIFKVLNIFIP